MGFVVEAIADRIFGHRKAMLDVMVLHTHKKTLLALGGSFFFPKSHSLRSVRQV
jgi:hypothetical protein